MIIAELEKRVEKYEPINNLAQAQAGVTFDYVMREDINFDKNEQQRILYGKKGRAVVNFAVKDEVYAVSMPRHLLMRVDVFSESTKSLID